MSREDDLFAEVMATQLVLHYTISLLDNQNQSNLKEIIDGIAVTKSDSEKRMKLEAGIISRAQELVNSAIESTER